MKRAIFYSIFILSMLLSQGAVASEFSICQKYKLENEKIIRFTTTEKKLICGSEDLDGWEEIPEDQSEFFIKSFLQDRGYYFPQFSRGDDLTIVNAGDQTHIKRFKTTGDKFRFIKSRKFRGMIRAILTPSKLTEIEGRVADLLQEKGYACPKVNATADARTGVVTVNIAAGKLEKIKSVVEKKAPKELKLGVLRRYDAFKIGKRYNKNLLSLTSRRAQDDGIVTSTYFLTDCECDGVVLEQNTIAGKPRLFIVGFGASTEEYGIGKLSWKHSRMGKLGSSIRFLLYGSYRLQRFLTKGNIYFLSDPSRWHIAPELEVKRENERQYEMLTGRIYVPPAVTHDWQKVGLQFSFGPEFNYTHTFRGDNKGSTHFIAGAARIRVMSHDFEFFKDEPKSGFRLDAFTNFTHKATFSSFTAQRFKIGGVWVTDLAGFRPPMFLFGIRGGASTTLVNSYSNSYNKLPPDYLSYLGGSHDVRGFARESLPKSPDKSLTSAYIGAELRLAKVLPMNIQPIIFADAGVLGEYSFNFDYPLYWSPGFGIRWPSPFGVFRATAARGYVVNNNKPNNQGVGGWTFFFSFGEEF
ncbi:MAG: BamA/TamA family outer membrane protein [Deltaproteobacteria bacterium]|nr:BamA/TamA family outer membrane protein [Deltaproteobacteria bacterium]